MGRVMVDLAWSSWATGQQRPSELRPIAVHTSPLRTLTYTIQHTHVCTHVAVVLVAWLSGASALEWFLLHCARPLL